MVTCSNSRDLTFLLVTLENSVEAASGDSAEMSSAAAVADRGLERVRSLTPPDDIAALLMPQRVSSVFVAGERALKAGTILSLAVHEIPKLPSDVKSAARVAGEVLGDTSIVSVVTQAGATRASEEVEEGGAMLASWKDIVRLSLSPRRHMCVVVQLEEAVMMLNPAAEEGAFSDITTSLLAEQMHGAWYSGSDFSSSEGGSVPGVSRLGGAATDSEPARSVSAWIPHVPEFAEFEASTLPGFLDRRQWQSVQVQATTRLGSRFEGADILRTIRPEQHRTWARSLSQYEGSLTDADVDAAEAEEDDLLPPAQVNDACLGVRLRSGLATPVRSSERQGFKGESVEDGGAATGLVGTVTSPYFHGRLMVSSGRHAVVITPQENKRGPGTSFESPNGQELALEWSEPPVSCLPSATEALLFSALPSGIEVHDTFTGLRVKSLLIPTTVCAVRCELSARVRRAALAPSRWVLASILRGHGSRSIGPVASRAGATLLSSITRAEAILEVAARWGLLRELMILKHMDFNRSRAAASFSDPLALFDETNEAALEATSGFVKSLLSSWRARGRFQLSPDQDTAINAMVTAVWPGTLPASVAQWAFELASESLQGPERFLVVCSRAVVELTVKPPVVQVASCVMGGLTKYSAALRLWELAMWRSKRARAVGRQRRRKLLDAMCSAEAAPSSHSLVSLAALPAAARAAKRAREQSSGRVSRRFAPRLSPFRIWDDQVISSYAAESLLPLGAEEISWDARSGAVTSARVHETQARIGWTYIQEGRFLQGLGHLLLAGERPKRVLALFPQVIPRGVVLRRRFPVRVGMISDAVLPGAIDALIRYLAVARFWLALRNRRFELRQGRLSESGGAAATPCRDVWEDEDKRDFAEVVAMAGPTEDAVELVSSSRRPSRSSALQLDRLDQFEWSWCAHLNAGHWTRVQDMDELELVDTALASACILWETVLQRQHTLPEGVAAGLAPTEEMLKASSFVDLAGLGSPSEAPSAVRTPAVEPSELFSDEESDEGEQAEDASELLAQSSASHEEDDFEHRSELLVDRDECVPPPSRPRADTMDSASHAGSRIVTAAASPRKPRPDVTPEASLAARYTLRFLLSSENRCNAEEVAFRLEGSGKWPEHLLLLTSRQQYRDALIMLYRSLQDRLSEQRVAREAFSQAREEAKEAASPALYRAVRQARETSRQSSARVRRRLRLLLAYASCLGRSEQEGVLSVLRPLLLGVAGQRGKLGALSILCQECPGDWMERSARAQDRSRDRAARRAQLLAQHQLSTAASAAASRGQQLPSIRSSSMPSLSDEADARWKAIAKEAEMDASETRLLPWWSGVGYDMGLGLGVPFAFVKHEPLDSVASLALLKQCQADESTMVFLEVQVEQRGIHRSRFADILARLYVGELVQALPSVRSRQEAATGERRRPPPTEDWPPVLELRQKLCALLERVPGLPWAELLAQLPPDDLAEERAILLRRLHLDGRGLAVCATELGGAVGEYCDASVVESLMREGAPRTVTDALEMVLSGSGDASGVGYPFGLPWAIGQRWTKESVRSLLDEDLDAPEDRLRNLQTVDLSSQGPVMSSMVRRSEIYGQALSAVRGDPRALEDAIDFVRSRAGSALGSAVVRALPEELSVASLRPLLSALLASTARDVRGALAEHSLIKAQHARLEVVLKQQVAEVEQARAAFVESTFGAEEEPHLDETMPSEEAALPSASASSASAAAALSASERLKHRRKKRVTHVELS
jgi:hypothetical protein